MSDSALMIGRVRRATTCSISASIVDQTFVNYAIRNVVRFERHCIAADQLIAVCLLILMLIRSLIPLLRRGIRHLLLPLTLPSVWSTIHVVEKGGVMRLASLFTGRHHDHNEKTSS